jgi:hypothetical protein
MTGFTLLWVVEQIVVGERVLELANVFLRDDARIARARQIERKHRDRHENMRHITAHVNTTRQTIDDLDCSSETNESRAGVHVNVQQIRAQVRKNIAQKNEIATQN